MKKILLQFFTWWNGQTLGTRFYTWRCGTKVGTDEFGNTYYTNSKKLDGRERRWVIYNGYSEATSIGAGWHGWIHHRVDSVPSSENHRAANWQKAHESNKTGAHVDYKTLREKNNAKIKSAQGYDAWTPNQSS